MSSYEYSEIDFYSSDEDDASVTNRSIDFDFYNEFNKFKTDEALCETTSNILALSGPRICALNPYEVVKLVDNDTEIEKKFLSNIDSLHSLVHVCDKAIEIFHIVNSEFVGIESLLQNITGLEITPYESSSDNKYSQQSHPKMAAKKKNSKNIESFFQLKQVRFVVFNLTTHIRQLSAEIVGAVERVEASKGARTEEAKNDITKSLTELEKCADQVQELETTLKGILQTDPLKLLRTDMGWDRSEISDTLDQAGDEIVSLEKKQREVHIALRCLQGKLCFYNDLKSATRKHLPRSHKNMEAKEQMTEEHKQRIAEIQQFIEQVTQTVISPEHEQWLHWWTTTGSCEKIESLIESERTKYCDSFIFVRTKGKVESMNGFLTDELQKKIALEDLEELYTVFHSKYSKTKDELNSIKEDFELAVTQSQLKIHELLTKVTTIPEKDRMLTRSVTYIELLIKAIENENRSASPPFYALLSGIQTLVQTDVQVLSNEDGGDRFIAGKRLKKQAAFLLSYAERMMYL